MPVDLPCLNRLSRAPADSDAAALPASEARRRLLRLALLGPAALGLAGLAGCSTGPGLQGSFLQPWQSHLSLSRTQWRRRMGEMHALGCREVVLQWVGLYGGKDPDWRVPDEVLETIFETAGVQGMNVRVGLPFDNRWWAALQQDPRGLQDFFTRSREEALAFMASAPWPQRRRFAGWYIPYELEQYHWAEPARQDLLCTWLQALSQGAQQAGRGAPAMSTYFSRLETQGTLRQLWSTILDRAQIRPMVQDGVGVAGWPNLSKVAPLIEMLRERGVPFDVIVELFEELPSEKNDGTDFRAQSADWARVQRQLEWAAQTGAEHIVGFAVDPWVTNDDERARALRRSWRRSYF